MKKLFTTLSLSLATLMANAEIPSEIHVYSSLPNGTSLTEPCRQVMSLYEKQYNAKVTFFIRPGAEGINNIIESYNSKAFTLICGGLTDTVFNPVKFPNYKHIFDDIRFTAVVIKAALTFYTSTSNPYPDLVKFLENKKRINVGYHRVMVQAITESAFKGIDVNWIPYKSPNDAITQIADGSLDLYLSFGSFSELVRANKLKSLGHVNGNKDIQGRDLTEVFPGAKNYQTIIGFLSYKSKITNEDSAEFERRVHALIANNKEFEKAVLNYDSVPYTPTQEVINRHLKNWRELPVR